MKSFISVLAIICSSQFSVAQLAGDAFNQTGGTSENLDMGLSDVMRKIKTTDNTKLAKVKGSPYLFDEWNTGKMLTKGGSIVRNIKLKYDCYSNRLVGKRNRSQDSVLVNTDVIQAFQLENIEDSAIVFQKYKVSNNLIKRNEEVFYRVLYEGEVSLLNYQYKKIRHFDQGTSSIVDTSQPRLVLENELFFIKKDGTNISIKKNGKKKVLSFFGYHENELSKYVKSNKLQLKSEDDMINLAIEYNRISNN